MCKKNGVTTSKRRVDGEMGLPCQCSRTRCQRCEGKHTNSWLCNCRWPWRHQSLMEEIWLPVLGGGWWYVCLTSHGSHFTHGGHQGSSKFTCSILVHNSTWDWIPVDFNALIGFTKLTSLDHHAMTPTTGESKFWEKPWTKCSRY